MRTNLKSAMILFILSLFSYTTFGQDLKQFNVIKNYDVYNINPNFAINPIELGLKYRLSTISKDFSYESLQENYKSLFEKVEGVLDEKEYIIFTFNFDKNGKMIYGYFSTQTSILTKLNNTLLLEIYNTFIELKVTEIVEENNPEGLPAFGQIILPFGVRKK